MRPFLILALALFAAGTAHAEASPKEVIIGAYVNDIQNLDLKAHSYSADVYLWFRWKDPELDPASSLGFVNPFELWGHTRTTDFEKPLLFPGGEYYQVLRNQGLFSSKLALYDYPFDRQKLVIEFEDSLLESGAMSYVVGPESVTLNPDLTLPGFSIGKATLTVSPHAYPTSFGDPRQPRNNRFSRARIEIPIERPVLTYSLKLLVPISCVILCAALMFLFNPSYVDARVGIGITALLTIVALQITLNEDLPEVDYLVLMDKIYLASYLFVIAGLGLVVKSTWLIERGEHAAAARLDRRSLIALSALYLTAMTVIISRRLI